MKKRTWNKEPRPWRKRVVGIDCLIDSIQDAIERDVGWKRGCKFDLTVTGFLPSSLWGIRDALEAVAKACIEGCETFETLRMVGRHGWLFKVCVKGVAPKKHHRQPLEGVYG